MAVAAAAIAGDPSCHQLSRPRGGFFHGPLLHSVTLESQPLPVAETRPAWGSPELIPMQTDYTAAIVGVTALVILLTGMTVFVLSRPSDLAPRSPR